MYGVDGQIRIDLKIFSKKKLETAFFIKKQFLILISIKADVGC